MKSFHQFIGYINTHKKQSIFGGVVLFGVLLYVVAFFIPRTVEFSYAGATCVRQATLFPDIHRESGASDMNVSFENIRSIGSFNIFSTRTCFTPTSAPKPGEITVATAPWGSMLARKQYVLQVSSPPVADVSILDKPLPVSKDLPIELSRPDAVFSYRLEAGNRSADCEPVSGKLHCEVPSLKLGQGKKYELALMRQFKDEDALVVATKTVQTLRAVTLKKASIKNKQTIYAKPTSFSLVVDKPLKSAEVSMASAGTKSSLVDVKTEVNGTKITVRLSKQLKRETTYSLRLKQAEATDGSTLIEPKKLTFTMSGGPKVTGVSIGSSRVDSSAVAVIQFDQAIKGDVAKYVSLKGGSAVVSKASPSAVSVALQGLPRCKAFSLQVAAGMPSKYDIVSKSSWQFGSRTICHSLINYGTSVQGRPLHAYVFGSSGPVTMYVGAIHGSEPSSSGLMQAWVNHLEANPGLISGKRIVVVPTINPDGVAAGTRTNSRGVNLNRNFPTDNWESDIDDTDGKHKNGGGKKPLSEPEASALASLTRQYSPRLLLSFHAVGSLVQGDPGSPSASYAARYASIVGYQNATGQGGTFEYSITGGYEDWSWRNAGIPAMVIELGSYSAYYFDHHRPALEAML